MTADQRAREGDRRVVVVKGPETVHRVFTITRLDERLNMVDDAEAVWRRTRRRSIAPVAKTR